MTAAAVFRACQRVDGCPFVTTRDLRALDLRPTARIVALALGVSLSLHLVAMAALGPQEAVMTKGGGEAAPAALGTSFEDLATGSSQPAPPTDTRQPDAAPRKAAQQPAQALPDQPVAQAAAPAAQPSQQDAQQAIAVPPAQDAILPRRAQQEAAAPDLATPPPLPPVPSEQPVAPQPAADRLTAHAPPPATPVAQAPDTARLDTSPRPPARPHDLTPPRDIASAPPTPRGTAQQDAQRGAHQGTDGQAAQSATVPAAAAQTGNAAATSYPGEVMRRIQRVRQPRGPARGRVLVAFGIAADGTLASSGIAQSSGNAALDRMALEHIARAAPFAPPPSGAQRQFSFEFVAR